MHDADVLVLGAGTAGASAALHCARAGLRTVCLDRRPLAEAGARWVNDVPEGLFAAHGLPKPPAEAVYLRPGRFHMLAGWGPTRVTVEHSHLCAVDMRALVSSLHEHARRAGALLVGSSPVRHVDEGERPVLHCEGQSYRARYVLDATGLAGSHLLPRDAVAPGDLCAAAQAVFDLADPAGARGFFEEHGVIPGETLAFLGLAGGYSVLNLRLRGEQLAVLTGSIPALGHPSGAQLVEHFARGHRWVGARRFGGSRAIPLSLSRKPFATRSRALLGDAAGQVFPAHGSGIATGMDAGALCAKAWVEGGDLRVYERAWRARWGGIFRGYDLLRRASQGLSVGELAAMMRAGLFTQELVRAGLEQRPPPVGLSALGGTLAASARVPWMLPRVLRVLAGS